MDTFHYQTLGEINITISISRKLCIQSEKRFDFLKDLVSSVPELQGDMDHDSVVSVTPSELRHVSHTGHVPGVGRGRGAGHGMSSQPASRPVVPGTGRRRGRPPKNPGAPTSARTKRSIEKFVDDEYDCKAVVDVEDDLDDHVTPPAYNYNLTAGKLQQQTSSSPYYNQRSDPMSPGISFHMKVAETEPLQRTNSLPPPAPVYTPPPHRPMPRPPGLTPIVPKQNWSVDIAPHSSTAFHESTVQHHPASTNGHSSKSETNGNFTVSPLPSISIQNTNIQLTALHQVPQSNSSSSMMSSQFSTNTAHELDEDYDC